MKFIKLYLYKISIWLRLVLTMSSALFAASSVSSGFAAEVKQNKTRVVTLNAHCFNDDWQFRFSKILDSFIVRSPDVIAMQEICINPNTGEDQIEFIKWYLVEHGYDLKVTVAQYTHKSWNIYDEYVVIFSRHEPSKTDRGLLPQSLLQRGFVSLQVNGHWYVNTHLEYRGDLDNYRREQINFLINRYKHESHLFVGDFNSAPKSSEQGQFRDLLYRPIFPGPSHLGNDGNDSRRIDGYWLSESFQSQIKCVDSEIFLDTPVNGQHLSDHFAVQFDYWPRFTTMKFEQAKALKSRKSSPSF